VSGTEWRILFLPHFLRLDRAKIMADDRMIGVTDLPAEVVEVAQSDRETGAPVGDDLAAIERAHIAEILDRESGNKARGARALGLNRRSLYRLLDKYNIRLDKNGSSAKTSSEVQPS
jgi:transcriptional regulator of acetoin/glycerol metabolism